MINFAFIAKRKTCQNSGVVRHVFAVLRPQYHFCLFSLTIFPSCHVKQRGNQIAIDSIGQKTGVIVIDYDYPKLIHTIVIVIVIE
jgi:hypothetical protein